MQAPQMPANEDARQQALVETGLLDSAPEQEFDDITALVAARLGVPICLVSLVDRERQWFKSHHGLEATEAPRELSFCGHVVFDGAPLVVEDARGDARFADNPLVIGPPHVRSYAGFPLVSTSGLPLGTLCTVDHQPRAYSAVDREFLSGAARLVSHAIRRRSLLRWKDTELRTSLDEANAAVLLVDGAGLVEWASRRAGHLLGLAPAPAPQPVEFASLFAEEGSLRAALASTAREQRSAHRLRFHLRGASSQARALHLDLDPHTTAAPLRYVRCTLTDPSALESPERALRRYEAMFDACPELLATLDGRGHLDQLNPSWERVLGWTREELRAHPLTWFVQPQDVGPLQAALDGTTAPGPELRLLESRYRRKDGASRLLSSAISGAAGLVGLSARDITTQAEALQRFDFNNTLHKGLSELQRRYIESGTISPQWWERALQLLLTLTQSEFGFIGTVHEDAQGRYLRTHALSNIAWDDTTRRRFEASQGQGMVFRDQETLFGQVLVEGRTLVSNDVARDPRAHGRPPGHPPLRTFLGLPCGQGDQMRGMIGLANRGTGYSPELIADLETAGLVLGAVMYQSESEAARRGLESRLKAIVDSTLDVIITFDHRGIILNTNAAVREVFGYEPEAVVGQHVSMLMNHADGPQVDGDLGRALSTGERQVTGARRELLGRRKDGSEAWLELALWEDVAESGRVFHGILRDITARVQTEKRLRESAAQLSNALELAKAGSWELDLTADRFTFNDAFYRIFGVTAAQVGGYHRTPFEYATRFVHPEEITVVKAEIERALASTSPTYTRELEHRFIYADGRVGYLAVRILGNRDEAGKLTKLVGVVQDVTARREQELERLQMREQSRIASALSERVAELDRARAASALLTECVNFLQRSVSVEEGLELVARYVDRMYPQANIALYAMTPGTEELFLHTEVRRFGEHHAPFTLEPADCWALRTRGFYSVYPGGPHIRCRHGMPLPDGVFMCATISGADRAVGLICLAFAAEEFSHERGESADRLVRDLSRFETMAQSISGAMSTIILRESLQRLALVDELTGLPNRRAFLSNAARVAARARRTQDTIVVAIYDVDHFKSVNDTLGHDEGDRVLRRISELAQSAIRAEDLIGRLGGEEFGLLFVGTEQGVRKRIEALRLKIAQASILRDRPITVSVGYSVGGLDLTRSVDDLLKAADVALYAAKQGGRNCVRPELGEPPS